MEHGFRVLHGDSTCAAAPELLERPAPVGKDPGKPLKILYFCVISRAYSAVPQHLSAMSRTLAS